MYICVCVVNVFICMYIYEFMYVCMLVYVYMHVCMLVCICACMHICVHE